MSSVPPTGRLVRGPRGETGCLAWLRLLLPLVAVCAVGIALRAEADTTEEIQALFAATWGESPPSAHVVEAILVLGRRGRPWWKGGRFRLSHRFGIGREGPHLWEYRAAGTARAQGPVVVRRPFPQGSFLWVLDEEAGVRTSGPRPAGDAVVLGLADAVWVHRWGTDFTAVVPRNGEPLPD